MSFPQYPRYRNSGVEWLGEVPEHWTIRSIRSTARHGSNTFVDGDWIESPFITSEGVRLIQTGNIGVGAYKEQGFRYISPETFTALNCTEVTPGDVLICRLADPVGRACQAPSLSVRMITSVDVCILKTSEEVNPAFLVYVFSSAEYLGYLEGQCRGGTRDRVSRSFLGAVRIPLPPLCEQLAITDFLARETAKIDTLIAEQQRLIELLKEKRQAVISHAVTKGLDPNAPMKQSGIEWFGNIPAHWQCLRNKIVFREVDDRSAEDAGELLTVSHLTGVTRRSEKDVNMFLAETLEGYKCCRAGDLVINTMWAWMGALGCSPHDGLVSPSYNVYRPQDRRLLSPKYYDYFCRVPSHVLAMKARSTGVWESRLRLYPAAFLAMSVALPPIQEQEEIADFLHKSTGHFDTLIDEAERAIDLLQERRTALISAAVTGKIDVRALAEAA